MEIQKLSNLKLSNFTHKLGLKNLLCHYSIVAYVHICVQKLIEAFSQKKINNQLVIDYRQTVVLVKQCTCYSIEIFQITLKKELKIIKLFCPILQSENKLEKKEWPETDTKNSEINQKSNSDKKVEK